VAQGNHLDYPSGVAQYQSQRNAEMNENSDLEALVSSLEASGSQADSGRAIELRLQLEILKELRRAYLLQDTLQYELVEELRRLGEKVDKLRWVTEER
jgi:hypothetical protein